PARCSRRSPCASSEASGAGSAPDVVAALADQSLDLRLGHQVEVSGDRVLEAAGGQAEVDRALCVPAAGQTMTHAGSAGVDAADAVLGRPRFLFCRKGDAGVTAD